MWADALLFRYGLFRFDIRVFRIILVYNRYPSVPFWAY